MRPPFAVSALCRFPELHAQSSPEVLYAHIWVAIDLWAEEAQLLPTLSLKLIPPADVL